MLKKLCFLLLAVIFIHTAVFAGIEPGDDPPDVFAYQNVRIEANQIVERVVVSSATATIRGAVKDGILVIDGNVILEPGAWVQGRIVVLGGQTDIRPGAYAEHQPWVLAPAQMPYTGTVLTTLLCAATLAVFVIPYLLWAFFHLLRNMWWFQRLKHGLLRIQHRWPALYIAISLAISGLMLLSFSQLAWKTMFRQTMGIFDNTFIWVVRYFASPSLDPIMIFVTNLGYGSAYLALVSFSLLLLAYLRRWLECKALLICLLGGALLNNILKVTFQRSRPEDFRIVDAFGYSFPSGHAMVSLCLYGMLAFIIARNIRSRHGRIAVAAAAILLVSAIGISRIYLGVHYPSDVVAGYTAGGTWLAFSISLLMWWEHKRKKAEYRKRL